LLRHGIYEEPGVLEVVTHTLENMASGGIFDQVGGGFHRYSTDERWLIPHFEKMLYDNALLAQLYTRTYQVAPGSLFEHVANETLAFVKREMTHPEGGFYSALDADSGDVQGAFYVWDHQEFVDVLGDRGPMMAEYYGVTGAGNLAENTSVLHVARDVDVMVGKYGMPWEEILEIIDGPREKLCREREKRVHPFQDEKVIAAWNGMMISAFAVAGTVFDSEEFISVAEKAAGFIRRALTFAPGRYTILT